MNYSRNPAHCNSRSGSEWKLTNQYQVKLASTKKKDKTTPKTTDPYLPTLSAEDRLGLNFRIWLGDHS